jgi:hypothetical protein
MDTVQSILSTHANLLKEKRNIIKFEKDFEGKRMLNQQIQNFYRKNFVISETALIDIVVTSCIIIEKMGKIQNCGWDIAELRSQLNTGIKYYQEGKIEHHYNSNDLLVPHKNGNSFSSFQTDLRSKYPATMKTIDGHYVRSNSEILIDNFLYVNNIVHAYERKLPVEECVYSDFYIPTNKDRSQGVYIEFWGMENVPKYDERKKQKIGIYKKYNFSLIELNETDIGNLEEVLAYKLIPFKIKIY